MALQASNRSHKGSVDKHDFVMRYVIKYQCLCAWCWKHIKVMEMYYSCDECEMKICSKCYKNPPAYKDHNASIGTHDWVKTQAFTYNMSNCYICSIQLHDAQENPITNYRCKTCFVHWCIDCYDAAKTQEYIPGIKQMKITDYFKFKK